MEGRNNGDLEWRGWEDFGHSQIANGFVHITPAAGNHTRTSLLPQNQSVLSRHEISSQNKRMVFGNNGSRINPNLGDSNEFQVNPDLRGDIGFNFNPDFSTLYDIEAMFAGMGLSSNQSGIYGNNPPANSGIPRGFSPLSSFAGLNNRMQSVDSRGYARSVTMNKAIQGFVDPNTNVRDNRNGFRVRSNNVLMDYPYLPINNNNSNHLNLYVRNHQAERYRFSSLEELRGKILGATKDQQSCRVLQQKLEEGKPEEVEMIFSEVKNHVCELMVDQSGNYLIQKLFQVCNQRQMNDLLSSVIRDHRLLADICLDAHGTRAMQTMLRHLTTVEQRALVVAALRHITVLLTKSVNGHHVVQHCVNYFSNEEKKQILNMVADNCLDIATDKSGCCVLQHCVENADVQSRERLMAEITANSLVLSEHPYGNYVVQNILGLRIPHATLEILKQLSGSFISLSMNKYGSNVVEKCLKESEENQAMSIIDEIVSSPNFLMVLQDPFGNYVVQSALAIAKGPLRHVMINIINLHYGSLHSHPHGKRVLAKTRVNKTQRV